MDVKLLLARLEILEGKIMGQVDEMNTILTRIANGQSKIAQDIQVVIAAIKAKVPPEIDLTPQLTELTQIADNLDATDAAILAEMPVAGGGAFPPVSHRRGGP